jgi:hypothetical protein
MDRMIIAFPLLGLAKPPEMFRSVNRLCWLERQGDGSSAPS